MIDILLCVPTFEKIHPETFKSIYNLKKPQGVKLDFDFVKGYGCAQARNKICNKAINGNYSYVFMVDSDIVLPDYSLNELLKTSQQLKYVMSVGYYPRRSDPKKTEVFVVSEKSYDDSSRLEIGYLKSIKNNSSIQISGCGLGCSLINTDIFAKLNYPYFKYVEYCNKEVLSEDLYFCEQLNTLNIPIYVNPKVCCKHIKEVILEG